MAGSDLLEKILEIAGPALSGVAFQLPFPLLERAGPRAGELLRLLESRNGFYAFESALHVMPTGRSESSLDVVQWNSETLWRAEYGDLTEGCLFFAEDIFGNQFCIQDGEIQFFDAETADREFVARDLDGWALKLLDDYDTMIGYPSAHQWQALHGPLEAGKRLVPKVPFVAGGEYSLSNLYASDAVQGMKFRGYLASQIRNLPEGAKIEFKITQ